MTLPGLFDVILKCPAHPDQVKPCPICLTRVTDPETSKEAVKKSRARYAVVRANVMALLESSGPITDKTLIARYRHLYGSDVAESTIRTRRHELAQDGRVSAVRVVDGQTLWALVTR